MAKYRPTTISECRHNELVFEAYLKQDTRVLRMVGMKNCPPIEYVSMQEAVVGNSWEGE